MGFNSGFKGLKEGANTSVYHRTIIHLPNTQFYTTITKTNHIILHWRILLFIHLIQHQFHCIIWT